VQQPNEQFVVGHLPPQPSSPPAQREAHLGTHPPLPLPLLPLPLPLPLPPLPLPLPLLLPLPPLPLPASGKAPP